MTNASPVKSAILSRWLAGNWLPATVATVAGVSVLIVLRETPWPFDPMFYMDNAGYFNGTWPFLAEEHRAMRWGLVVPMGLLQRVFGYSEASYYGIPILATVVFVLGVYWLARRLMGSWWAGAAAFVSVANPIVLSRSSHPFPDVLGTALVTAGIACLVWIGQGSRRRDLVLATSAGLMFGYSFAVREVVIIVAPVIVVALILMKVRWRELIVLVASALIVLGVELYLMNLWYDDPLARWNVLLSRNTRTGEVPNPAKASGVAAFQGTLGLSFTAMFRKFGQWGFSWLPIAGLVGLVSSWLLSEGRFRSRVWMILGSWLVVGWLIFVVIGPWQTARGGYVFNLTQVRYWYLLVPPMVIGVVGLLHALGGLRIRVRERRYGLGGVASLLAVVLCLFVVDSSRGLDRQIASGTDHMLEFRDWIVSESEGIASVAGAHRTIRIANMYDNGVFGEPLWDGQTARQRHTVSPTVFVIADEDRRAGSVVVQGTEYELSVPPLAWDLLLVSEDGFLALLAAGDRDGMDNVESPATGPADQVHISGGDVVRWHPPDGDRGSYRFRVYFEGPIPVARCARKDPSGGFKGSTALHTGEGVATSEERAIDMYCPSDRGILALRAPDGSDVVINHVTTIYPRSSD